MFDERQPLRPSIADACTNARGSESSAARTLEMCCSSGKAPLGASPADSSGIPACATAIATASKLRVQLTV
eukprot:6193344-Prymnesium_polylepis.1